MAAPYSIRIFQLDGDPNGIRTIEKSNWTGQGLAFPRSLISEASKRKELKRTGVYVLLGESDSSSLPAIYIGEGDPILDRLKSHYSGKEFWTSQQGGRPPYGGLTPCWNYPTRGSPRAGRPAKSRRSLRRRRYS